MTRKMVAFMLALVALTATEASADWRMAIESKTVAAGQTGVTVDFTFTWDRAATGFFLPLVARSVDPGSFWTGNLPQYDEHGGNGVAWRPGVVPWAELICRLAGRTAKPTTLCQGQTLDPYDAVSPDYLYVVALGIDSLAAQPAGVVFVTMAFDVSTIQGQFEFDTACYSPYASTISMMDYTGIDHGPQGTGDVVFTKGIITIGPACDCSHQGDASGNGVINIADLAYLINYALKGTKPPPVADPTCPALNRGDWDCNGRINLADIAGMAAYLFRIGLPPCDPCAH